MTYIVLCYFRGSMGCYVIYHAIFDICYQWHFPIHCLQRILHLALTLPCHQQVVLPVLLVPYLHLSIGSQCGHQVDAKQTHF